MTGESVRAEIVELATALVRIPSRAGIDAPAPVLDCLAAWLDRHAVPHERLTGSRGDVGIHLRLPGRAPGPTLCLNACLDTAAFGDIANWSDAPTSGIIRDGRLWGRGSADSKMGVALFSVLAAHLLREGGPARGALWIVFDADEHSGRFEGIRRFLETVPHRPDGVLIGYPGNDALVVGSRGFLRAVITVRGTAAHSGSKRRRGENAIHRAAALVTALVERPLPAEADPEFAFGPQLNITEIRGGETWSVVPDRCDLRLDVRLTPSVSRAVAAEWVQATVADADARHADARRTVIDWQESWPAYRVPDDCALVQRFTAAAHDVFRRPIPSVISGPSNIGNYLASLGIPALSGFGVTHDNLHAADEWADLASVLPVYETYRSAVERLLARDWDGDCGVAAPAPES